MNPATDQELVLGFRPDAQLESRPNPRTGATEYRATCAPVPGRRAYPVAWSRTEALAWRAACIRMGLRIRRG